MKIYQFDVEKHLVWHVPVSVATLAIGIYLSVICIVPTFTPELREFLLNGVIFVVIPYVIFILIGSPVYTLWHYAQKVSRVNFISKFSRQETE